MNCKLDLRSIQKPAFELTLLDESATTVHIHFPSRGKIKEVSQLSVRLKLAADSGEVIDSLYDTIAELISDNDEELTITGEELAETYGITVPALMAILTSYLNFIKSVGDSKN